MDTHPEPWAARADMLALYDYDERQAAEEPGMRRDAAPGVVRLVDLVGTESAVVWSHLDADSADAAISRELAYFERLRHNLEWKLYAHDEPRDLHERLLDHGFLAEDSEAVMVLDLTRTPEALLGPVPAYIHRVTDGALVADVTHVRAAVWPGEHASLEQRLRYLLRVHPARLSVYVAYVDGEPVSAARIHFSQTGTFASLWGGATLPDFRGRGLYTALLAVRVQEAMRRGARFLTIDAGPMSRPIVERLGFRLLTYSQAHLYRTANRLAKR